MDPLSVDAPDYHRCKYCKDAFIDGFQVVLPDGNFSTEPVKLWPVLQISVSDAQKARGSGYALFQLFGSINSQSWRKFPCSNDTIEVCLISGSFLSNSQHSHMFGSKSVIVESEPSKRVIGWSHNSRIYIFAPQGIAPVRHSACSKFSNRILGSLSSKWIDPAPNGDFRSQSSLNFVRECLSDCLSRHKKCNQHEKLQQPSRLLDLDSPFFR
jgi:hypothetical protein